MEQSEIIERLWKLGPMFIDGAPHSHMMGMKFIAVDVGRATISLPYNTDLIGNPKTRVLHGGAITALLDQACGLAAIAGFDTLQSVATLNLSIDYMRAAKPGETVIASAHCFKTTKNVAFVRSIAHDGDESDPVAMAQATFMATGLSKVAKKEKLDIGGIL